MRLDDALSRLQKVALYLARRDQAQPADLFLSLEVTRVREWLAVFGSEKVPEQAPSVRGSLTSEAAARRLDPQVLSETQSRVLAVIRERGGLTDEEIEFALDMRHQSASARRRDLVLKRLVLDSGQVRRTTSGRDATVWIVRTNGS